jgi:hypothetical protein
MYGNKTFVSLRPSYLALTNSVLDVFSDKFMSTKLHRGQVRIDDVLQVRLVRVLDRYVLNLQMSSRPVGNPECLDVERPSATRLEHPMTSNSVCHTTRSAASTK